MTQSSPLPDTQTIRCLIFLASLYISRKDLLLRGFSVAKLLIYSSHSEPAMLKIRWFYLIGQFVQDWWDCIKPSVQDYQLRLGFGGATLTKHGINLSVSLKILSDHFCKIEVPGVSPGSKNSDYCSDVPKDLERFRIYFITHPLYLMDGHSSKDEQTVASCSAISSIWFGFHCPKNDFMDKLWSSVKAWKDTFLVFHALRKNMMYLCTMSHVSWHFYLTIN